MAPILVLLFGVGLVLVVIALGQWLDGRRGNALAIFVSGSLTISLILALSYGYLHRWSNASVEQKQKLADVLPGCPKVRASAKEEIQQGPSSGIAQRLIEDCAQERVELSASE